MGNKKKRKKERRKNSSEVGEIWKYQSPRDPLKIFRMAWRLTGGWLALHREGLYQLFFWFGGLIYGLARLVALQIIIYIAFVAFLCLLGCLWLWICLLTAFSNTLQSLTHFNHQHFFKKIKQSLRKKFKTNKIIDFIWREKFYNNIS